MNRKPNTFSKIANDANVRGIFFQVVLIVALGFSFFWLIDNTLTNLSNQGKSLGFGFLRLFSVLCLQGLILLRLVGAEILSIDCISSRYLVSSQNLHRTKP